MHLPVPHALGTSARPPARLPACPSSRLPARSSSRLPARPSSRLPARLQEMLVDTTPLNQRSVTLEQTLHHHVPKDSTSKNQNKISHRLPHALLSPLTTLAPLLPAQIISAAQEAAAAAPPKAARPAPVGRDLPSFGFGTISIGRAAKASSSRDEEEDEESEGKPAAAAKSNNPFAGLLPFGKASASVDVEDEEEEEDEEPEQKAKPGLFGFGGTTAVKKSAPVSKVRGPYLCCLRQSSSVFLRLTG